ncbi:HIRAN domain-containing protein [Salmonella enterica]|uniref:HIRAN domain-containing protein n=1 Tax=Salmonella enterica TaxID=28901 RepID=UPI00127BD1BE|nr:HIRAN domain-containing protein [Salmonella enterica]EDE4782494.1 restriction endonuclease [Salmonella enterica subsp. enterica serovar Enteritidis]EEL8172910.1 restriction endonuclease [Salmonella enterica subsp. enterica serovar Infantis]EBN0814464.1 restriction endonuclease [Salmonella enterica]EEL9550290.1 restriction endonuclease [Salmonella enterica subsp. enterica serovar Panama]EGO0259052.1 restriction endonuclease [Salmonella enterica subsp. enterica serovar Panama]
MNRNDSVYVAWQAPDTHDWHVVGNLQARNAEYVFNYTKGALTSSKFTKFSGMNDFSETYVSEELFPLFKNRLLSPKRPEYPKFIHWLGLDGAGAEPIEILARSGGMRSTDQLQMFKRIEIGSDGYFEHFFFAHGLRYMSHSANERVSSLNPGDSLRLCLDVQNGYDKAAVLIRADNPAEIVGYCPRYFASDINRMLLDNDTSISLSVERISDDAPHNYRLLCKVVGEVSRAFLDQMILQEEFQPVV